ncbi:MAG: hypothetical protein K9K88_17700 [Desulfobacterales bacterium]|nr:hypothetical protein [Desulfobacterales bacterium]
MGFAEHEFAGSCFFEPLGGGPVRLDLGHRKSPYWPKNNDGVSMEKISARHLLSGFVCLLPLHDGYSESELYTAGGTSTSRR